MADTRVVMVTTFALGEVTGFLGPNGAGKSTTMRLILGLDAPSSGSVTVNGRPYAEYPRPLFEVGALLDSGAVHGGRSAGGLHLSQIALGVLGVLVITSEYSTGMIRASLSAVPQRRLMLAAKTIVFAAAALIVAILSCFAAYFVFKAFLPGDSLRSAIGDPGVLRAVIGGGLYLTALGLLGLGLGAIIRSSAGAVATLLGLLFVPPLLLELLPSSWKDTINPYVPLQAGSTIFSVHHQGGALGVWSGFGIFCLYAVIALGVGFVLINHRDA